MYPKNPSGTFFLEFYGDHFDTEITFQDPLFQLVD